MQFSTLSKTFALSLLLAAMVGCSSDPKKDGSASSGGSGSEVRADASASGGINGQDTDDSMSGMPEMLTIYFDFDRSEIKSVARDTIEMHAKYMTMNNSARVILEGHCDERGTVEYNLALGERRSNSVKRVLIANGVNPDQIETVSFGEERPSMPGHDESAWSKNRRVEFKYQN
jgi:peptidoglycan-associated lipoprotein